MAAVFISLLFRFRRGSIVGNKKSPDRGVFLTQVCLVV
jgi:hypothetical protein